MSLSSFDDLNRNGGKRINILVSLTSCQEHADETPKLVRRIHGLRPGLVHDVNDEPIVHERPTITPGLLYGHPRRTTSQNKGSLL